jgi:excisionase family DNA binding protein
MEHMNHTLPYLPETRSSSSPFVSVSEAARILRVSRTTVWRWITLGKLPASRVGSKNLRIRQDDLERLVQPARQTEQKGGPSMERVRLEKPSQEEITRRQALVKQIFANRDRRIIAPLTSVDLIRTARAAEQESYGKPTKTH